MVARFNSATDLESSWIAERYTQLAEIAKSDLAKARQDYDAETRSLDREIKDLDRKLSRELEAKDKADLRRHRQTLVLQFATLDEILKNREFQIERARVDDERHAEQLRRDFALWRQTPEGRAFEDWCYQAGPLSGLIMDITETWNASYRKQVTPLISDDDKKRAARGIWVERRALGAAFYMSVTALVGGLAGLIFLTLQGGGFSSALWVVPAVLFIFVCVIAYRTKNSKEWREENLAVARKKSLERRAAFGYDPLSGEAPPSPWRDNGTTYARSLRDVAVDAIHTHPHPANLPRILPPALKDASDITYEPMRPVFLRTTDQYFKELQEL